LPIVAQPTTCLAAGRDISHLSRPAPGSSLNLTCVLRQPASAPFLRYEAKSRQISPWHPASPFRRFHCKQAICDITWRCDTSLPFGPSPTVGAPGCFCASVTAVDFFISTPRTSWQPPRLLQQTRAPLGSKERTQEPRVPLRCSIVPLAQIGSLFGV
jgi:hypothetical protein